MGAAAVDRRSVLAGGLAAAFAGGAAWAAAPADEEATRRADLVIANHFLAARGLLEGLGHVSVRSALRPDHYVMARSLAPELVTAADLIEFDADSVAIGDTRRPYSERFIHGEIYRVRPDVQAVVHSHAPALLPFGLTRTPIVPLIHTAGFLTGGTPVFEIAEVAGPDSDMLVADRARGAALARVLGQAPLVLMRGHGVAIVAPGLRQAVYRAVYTVVDAEVQEKSAAMGRARPLSPGEARAADAINEGPALDRIWELWARTTAR